MLQVTFVSPNLANCLNKKLYSKRKLLLARYLIDYLSGCNIGIKIFEVILNKIPTPFIILNAVLKQI